MWAKDETLIILLSGVYLRTSNNNPVNKKWPKWLVPNCISKPYLVVYLSGIDITLIIIYLLLLIILIFI